MAWSLPRLLRRLRPELAHFQHALPLGFRGRAVVTRPRPLVRARPGGDGPRSTGCASRRSCRARPAAPTSVLAGLGAHEARPRRPLRDRAGEDHVTPNGVDPAFAPGGERRTAATSSSSARSRRGRTRSRRWPPRRRSACRSSSPGPRRSPRSRASSASGGADVRGYVEQGRARRALPRRGRARPAVALRGLRPAGARGDGVRHAGRRRRRARAAGGRRRRGRLRGRTATSRRPCAGRSPSASGSSRPASSARGASRGRRRARLTVEVVPRGARVKVAAIVVSHGHPRELERSLPALRAAGRRARRDRQRPGLRCRPGSTPSHNERPLGFAANVNRGVALTTGELVVCGQPGRRSRSRAPSRRCARSWRRIRAAASPGRRWSSPTARRSRRGAASRPSTGTIVRRTPLRLVVAAARTTTTSTRRARRAGRRPTGCSAAS